MPKKNTALTWITTEAKRIRRQYPKRFKKWTEYVAQASAIYASKHKGKSPVGKKTRKPKRARVGNNVQYKPVSKVVHCEKVGSVSFHMAKARKQVEEQLAWMLLARDQAKTKRSRNELSKKVIELRSKLRKLS